MRRSDVLTSNFIIFLTLLIGTVILGVFSELTEYYTNEGKSLSEVFQGGIFGSLISFFLYGLVIWPFIIILNLITEIVVLKKKNTENEVVNVFLIEIVIISAISIYLSVRYTHYYWLLLIPIFSIGEYFRIKYLKN
jgi:hypothetical protein